MFELIGTVFIGVTLAVLLTAVVTSVPLSTAGRLALAAVSGLWVSVAVGVAAIGALTTLPAVLALVGAPLLVATALALSAPAARRLAGDVPLPLLAGVNVFRVGGAVFLVMAATGQMSGPFPYLAGWGDVVTGVLALPAAWAIASGDRKWTPLVLAWNAFGMLDLIDAVTIGAISGAGSPIQLIHSVPGTAALRTLPLSLIPTVLVPFYLIVHAVIFARIFEGRSHASADRSAPLGQLGAAHR